MLMSGENKDVIIDAMTDELTRSMKSLQIEKMEKPYFLGYTISDNWQLGIEADFGSLSKSGVRRNRRLKVELRVGSYQLDNTGFYGRRAMFSSIRGRSRNIVVENDYNAIRHDIWLETDTVYKAALEQLAAKNAFIKNQAQTEEIPDFSKEKSVQLVAPRKTLEVDREKWEKTVKNLSAIFRKFPAIHESGVKFQVKVNHKYYVNSEGTVFRQPETLVSLVAFAATQAADGMKLKHYIPFYAPTVEALPREDQLAVGIRKMAEELTALASAPVVEEYIGPVLFTQQASAELFSQVLAPHLSGQRPPLSEEPRMAQMVPSSKLVQRLNRNVLPREISITDDPTRTVFEKESLIGSYQIDDQGVTARPVKLVEAGVLKTLLMSRRPRKKIANSNGHARAGSRGKTGVQIGNLFITADKGKTYKQLKKELLELCEDQQLPFGLIIKSVDNPTITGVDFSITSLMMRSSQTTPQMTSPVMMYRVFVKDGREELVRGISLSELTVGDLKDIAAVGKDYYVHHRLLTGARGMSSYFSFIFSMSGEGDMGIPGSIVAPSVLFEELEFKKTTETRKNPPLLPHPFFPK
jgi:predicted Zn-dependent protease